MGIYLFRRQVLEELLQDKNPGGTGRQDEHFGYDVIPHALRNGAKVPRACILHCRNAWPSCKCTLS